jgi:FkbM family methyltransferase
MDQLPGIMQFLGQVSDLPFAVRKLGLSATAALVRTHLEEYGSKIAGRPTSSAHALRSVRPKACAFPIYYRVHSTDINVLQQVFLSGEYDCAGFERGVEFVVDCGANIGCASAFFLNRYPESRVVAIEAELGNFGICRQTLEPYGSRVRAIHGAVWPRSEPLAVVRGEPEQVKEWAFSVRPCREGEPKEIDGISLNEVVESSPKKRIDLLKIDIEGGERELFASGFESWLSRTRTIVIETHGPECREVFLQAVKPYGFKMQEVEYVMIARRTDL